MKLLALDTATEACSVALMIDNEIMSDYVESPQQHAQIILPMIDALLTKAGITLPQLDAIAFGRGPGSFTGLRIAASVTQALAFGADLAVLPISNLAALAHAAWLQTGAQYVLSAIDARMHEVYWAGYQLNDKHSPNCVSSECVIKPEKIPLLKDHQWTAIGSGWRLYQEILVARYDGLIVEIVPIDYPHAESIAQLGTIAFNDGAAVTAELAIPVYLRDEVTRKPA